VVYGAIDAASGGFASDISGKEDKANKSATLSASSTDAQYPTSKAVYDALSGKETSSNKTTSITNASTDALYPSAKAVYGELSSLQSDIDAIDVSDKWAASLSFVSSTDLIYAAIPARVVSAYVASTFSDVSATLALKMAAANGSTFLTLSANPASPTNLSSYAGQTVKFQPGGMDASATVAVFGVRFNS
jgi:hypothetical protein